MFCIHGEVEAMCDDCEEGNTPDEPHVEPEPAIIEMCQHSVSLVDECMRCEAET